MALFGNLFDKKTCAICGGEIGLLGNRKLEDGNMCKNCCKLLSPLYSDRRGSTVAQIREHLAWRENNAREIAAMQPTRVFGSSTMKLYMDENMGKFCVTGASKWWEANPDLISFDQVLSCRRDVREYKREIYTRDPEGHRVSYDPPRFEREYSFLIALDVDLPWCDEISFELSSRRPQNPRDPAYRELEAECAELLDALRNPNTPDSAPAAAAPENGWVCECGAVNGGNFCVQCGKARPAAKKVFRCSKCGWTPEDQEHPPRFCPNCGDPFGEEDRAEA